jgi:hypothetical protein
MSFQGQLSVPKTVDLELALNKANATVPAATDDANRPISPPTEFWG